jgi:putative SOS response-associated peptidase YedK
VCARFTLTRSGRELARHFELPEVTELAPRYNVAPSQEVAAVREEPGLGRALRPLRWGLVPAWAESAAAGVRMVNARAESVAERPAYREALRLRRCIVPADGFYEWGGPERRPHLFRVRGGELFGLAGLWERWRDPADGGVLESCVLLTVEANARVRRVHDRMPVILSPRDYGRWLDPAPREPRELRGLLAPCPPEWLDATLVGDRVNQPGNDDPGCIEPQPETPSLFPDPC